VLLQWALPLKVKRLQLFYLQHNCCRCLLFSSFKNSKYFAVAALEICVVAVGIENHKITASCLTIVVTAVANSVEREQTN
jgi:hypothetical protein